jgi:hypothetical protein
LRAGEAIHPLEDPYALSPGQGRGIATLANVLVAQCLSHQKDGAIAPLQQLFK